MNSRSRLLDFSLIAILAAIATYIYRLSLTHRASISGDFPYYVQFAEGLALDPRTFDPMGVWPLGYPLALRALSGFGSWQEVGSLISFLALLTVAVASFFLLKTAYGAIPSFLGALATVLNPTVVKYAVGQSSDLPALAVSFVCVAFFSQWYRAKSSVLLFYSGIFAGLAYLTRYSSLSILLSLFLVLFLLFQSLRSSSGFGRALKQSSVNALILLAGWLIAASPQLIGSLIVHGNPMYTENGCNIALAIGWNREISGLTWLNVKDKFPECASIFAVVSRYPREFISNYLQNLADSFGIIRNYIALGLFGLLSVRGTSSSSTARDFQQRRFVVLTMSINAVVAILITSLAFVSDRHLILSTSFVGAFGVAAVACFLLGRFQAYQSGTLDLKAIPSFVLALPLSILALLFLLPEYLKTYGGLKDYRILSPETGRSLAVKSALESFGCNYLGLANNDDVDTVLVGDDFVDPSTTKKIGVQEWRNQYAPFQNLPAAKQWMLANEYNCIILDEPSLGGRIPGVDFSLWRKELEKGDLFSRRWSSKNFKTYVFAIK